MEPTRQELRLQHVQSRIEALYRDRGDRHMLPARYEALVKLEKILLDEQGVPNPRRERELVLLAK